MTDSMSTIRIGLFWHSINSDNLGVGALTVAHIAIIDAAAEQAGVRPHYVIFGWTDAREPYLQRDNITMIPLRMKDFVKPFGGLYSHLRGCDMVLDIGAGDSFTDIYGPKRIGTLLASKILTLMARKPLILSPQTIGPFHKVWARFMALTVMRRAYAVTTRDDLSTQFLRTMGYNGKLIEATDVALRLPYERPAAAQDGILRVGLNVSGLLYNGGYNRNNMFGLKSSYAELIHEILEHLGTQENVETHLIAHVIADDIEVEDDYRVCVKLADDYPSVVVAPKFRNPSEAKSYIAKMDFVAGARMHACIAAFSSGVPVLPMAYSRKFKGLFGTLGYDYLVDCQEDDLSNILDRFKAALADLGKLRSMTATSLEKGQSRLGTYEDALVQIMRQTK